MGLADRATYLLVLAMIGPVALAVTTSLNINFLSKPEPRDLIADPRMLRSHRMQPSLWQGRACGALPANVTAMIGYVTLGTNDLPRGVAFYDALFAELGIPRIIATDEFAYWGKRRGLGMLALYKPNDGQPATVGNGVMVALPVRSHERVQQAHRIALSLGAPDEGAPGPRGDNFYGAYFRDPDGNKLCVFTYESGPARP